MPEYGELTHSSEDLTVLLMGKQGSNVDTLMFAHVDTSGRDVTLISVPRDLYVNGL